MSKYFKVFVTTMAISIAAPVFAANHTINMLDENSNGEIMLFDPPFLKANVGDTVTFVAKNPGHNIISRLVPKGASDFKGEVSKNITVNLNKEGIYLYECDLHVKLGMVGLIQVGKPTNLAEAKAKAAELKQKMAMGSERLDEYLAEVH